MNVEHGATALEKKIMDIEQLNEFLKKDIVKPEKGGFSHCVDGRYEEGSLVSKPGADAGDVMVVMAMMNKLNVGLSTFDAMKIVVDVVGGVDKFSFHSDDHEIPTGVDEKLKVAVGCGHLKHAYNDPEAYGLKKEDMVFLMNELTKHKEVMHRDELKGHHEEQAVVVVESKEYSVAPKCDSDQFMESFVFQATSNDERLEKIADKIFEKLDGKISKELLLENLKKVSGDQLSETVSRLAKGLPVYKVKIDEAGRYEIVG